MLDFLELGILFVETLSALGDWLLHRPFYALFSAFEKLSWWSSATGHNPLVSPQNFASFASLLDFTVGELLFSSLLGVLIGLKIFKFAKDCL